MVIVTHDVSVSFSRFDRMSPAGLILAIALHVLAATALWWSSPFRPLAPTDDAIEVTIEEAAKPDAGPQTSPTPTPPVEATPLQPTPPTPPPPTIEQALPPPEPLPPLTSFDFPKPAPQPPQRTPPQPRLPTPPPPRPPADSQAAVPAPSPLHNPADPLVGQGRAQYDYFSQLARRLAQYRFYPRSARDNNEEGRVVIRVTIGRDGRLIDAQVEKSSGWPAIDAAELETIRKSAPFPPLPLQIPGDRATFMVPVTYELRDLTRWR